MFETYEADKRFTLVRNPNWDQSTDPNRNPLPDRIEVSLNVNADDIDNRLLSGDLDLDIAGTGVQAASQAKILNDANLKKNADTATLSRLWYTSLNPDVKPMDNVHCRKAVLYGADHEGYQRAYGGEIGGDIATNMGPPNVPGAPKVDLYNFLSKKNGDVDNAKKELTECGMPNGFETKLAYRVERPKEKATAESLQQSLAKVGIKLTLAPYPAGDYFKLYAGNPTFAKNNGLGMSINGWGADWNDPFAFYQQIVDSRTIRASGNYNLGIKIPAVDQMIDQANAETDQAKREALWGDIDKTVMENASVLPGVWAKVLLYRPPHLTNVFVNEGLGGFYDPLAIGVKK